MSSDDDDDQDNNEEDDNDDNVIDNDEHEYESEEDDVEFETEDVENEMNKEDEQNQRSDNMNADEEVYEQEQNQRSDYKTTEHQRGDFETVENQRSDADTMPPRHMQRPTTHHDYSNLHKTGFTFHQHGVIDKDEMHKEVTNQVIQTLMNHKEGQLNHKTLVKTYQYEKAIQKWGEVALEATIKEVAQLHRMDVLKPSDATKLTQKQIDESLNVITLVTQKRCGRMKGRTCADGRDQKNVPREERASPALALKGRSNGGRCPSNI